MIFPCDRNSTRSQTSSTSYMLWDVHRTPQAPCDAIRRILARISCAVAGSRDAVGSSRSSRCGSLSIALARHKRVCSPEERTPAFVSRKRSSSSNSSVSATRKREFELLEQCVDTLLKTGYAVDQSENAQILINREVAGKRRIHGREVGVLERLRSLLRDIDSFDADRTGCRFQDAQNHVDRCRFAGSVRTEQADDLVACNMKRYTLHGHCLAILFAESLYGKNVCHSIICFRYFLRPALLPNDPPY